MHVEVVLDAGARIGESPTWSTDERALYWIDVKKPALYRCHPGRNEQRSWSLPCEIGGFALLRSLDGAVVALRDGVYRLDFASGTLTQLAAAPFDPKLHRFNEAACDATGRFWIGVMFDPVEKGAKPEPSSLHSFTLHEGLRPEPDAAELHNGMAWSPDGSRFYLSHTRQREILVHDFDPGRGRIGNGHSSFAKIPDGIGVPDGAAMDTRVGYWCALHGGGRIRRFRADGSIDRDIALPVSKPTMCAFAGADLEDMYVTSASHQMDAAQRAREPLAGALLRLRPGEQGVPKQCVVQ